MWGDPGIPRPWRKRKAREYAADKYLDMVEALHLDDDFPADDLPIDLSRAIVPRPGLVAPMGKAGGIFAVQHGYLPVKRLGRGCPVAPWDEGEHEEPEG